VAKDRWLFDHHGAINEVVWLLFRGKLNAVSSSGRPFFPLQEEQNLDPGSTWAAIRGCCTSGGNRFPAGFNVNFGLFRNIVYAVLNTCLEES